jgi:hypothetical protein
MPAVSGGAARAGKAGNVSRVAGAGAREDHFLVAYFITANPTEIKCDRGCAVRSRGQLLQIIAGL